MSQLHFLNPNERLLISFIKHFKQGKDLNKAKTKHRYVSIPTYFCLTDKLVLSVQP